MGGAKSLFIPGGKGNAFSTSHEEGIWVLDENEEDWTGWLMG